MKGGNHVSDKSRFETTPQKVKNDEEHSSSIGLRNSLHGVIYQLKLLMLFLKRGYGKEYPFRLATEMDAAEKFDDIVFQYTKEDQGKERNFYRVLQAKHKQNDEEKITYNDLSNSDDEEEFSLKKYFISYRNIERKTKDGLEGFMEGEVKDYIICTNINFDLKDKKINKQKITKPDEFLKFSNSTKKSVRYKLIVDNNEELFKKLKDANDLNRLAKVLVKCIKKKTTTEFESLYF